MRRTRLAVALTVATAAVVSVPAAADAAPKPKPTSSQVQLIAMNDFHGRIQLTTGGDAEQISAPGDDGVYGTPDDIKETVGGAAYVSATVQRLHSDFAAKGGQNAKSLFVGAGDLVSASPFASAVFKDEPTIEVLDAMGLDVSSVGNHEFDRGTQELRRISGATDGTFTDNVTACQGVEIGKTGCFGTDEHAFDGADFPYLAANVVSKKTGQPMLPPYKVYDVPGGTKVALIGVVTETLPSIVDAAGIADIRVLDEVDAVNRYVPELVRQGVKAIGVLVHEGGQQDGSQKANPNGCDTLSGPIVDINNRISDQVDLIVSAHTHQAYNCKLPVPGGHDRLVTSAGFYGRLLSDIRLTINPGGDVDRSKTYTATNVPVKQKDVTPDAHVQSIVDYWVAKSSVEGSRHVGEANAFIGEWKSSQRAFEQPIGNLVAQAQLEALQSDTYGKPTIALMNPGGVRENINAGEITYAEVFAVQPFGNYTGAMTLTGADLDDLLEEQYQLDGPRKTQLTFGTNETFRWSYDLSKPYGERVPDDSITVDGVVINPAQAYRVAVNSFLAPGQDGFLTFKKGTNYVTGPVDVDAFEAYVAAHSPINPPLANHGKQIG